MAWAIEITKTAAKQLKKLDKTAQKRILLFLRTKLEKTNNPRFYGKALRGEKGDLWRYRIGDYRLICEINDGTLIVLILVIGHRKEIYRQ